MAAARAVLRDRTLLRRVASFQRGTPLCVVELVADFRARFRGRGAGLDLGLFWAAALRCGDLEDVQLVWRMWQSSGDATRPELRIRGLPRFAVVYGRLDVLQWLHEANHEPSPWPGTLLYDAVTNSHVQMAKWLLLNRPDACQEKLTLALHAVAANGPASLFEQIAGLCPHAVVPSVMDEALGRRQWDVIHFLHERFASVGCTTRGMDRAAACGHLDVVAFLHENRREGCSTDAMDFAASAGHLDVVRFLHEKRTEGCTTDAMDLAAMHGDIAMVRYLHDHRREGCTTQAMDLAAQNGHLDVVEFLHTQRAARCTDQAMIKAAENQHYNVVVFLHRTLGMAVPSWALSRALMRRDLDTVRYLHEVGGMPLDLASESNPDSSEDSDFAKYVKTHQFHHHSCGH